jgi:hypothetical protein
VGAEKAPPVRLSSERVSLGLRVAWVTAIFLGLRVKCPRKRGQTAILAAKQAPARAAVTQTHTQTWRCALQSTHKKARTVGEAVCRAWRPTGGLAAWGSRTGSVMSPVTPEARDCFQEGPGLPPKRPYRLMPDCSDPSKLGQGGLGFKPLFSMTGDLAIGAIVLTGAGRGVGNCAGAPPVSGHCWPTLPQRMSGLSYISRRCQPTGNSTGETVN